MMHTLRPRIVIAGALALVLLVAAQTAPRTSGARVQQPSAAMFAPAAPQGFGDRQNSIAWSMAWWRGRLYVGTGRALQCVQVATLSRFFPTISYPPIEPGLDCAKKPQDLPLRAEIWRWTPASDTWERVYQSPEDVPIPGSPGKYVARDIGFRSFLVYTEPDGSEALYAAGVSSRSMHADPAKVPPPRLLRSTDGVSFSAVPQAPGTELGDTEANGFRTLLALNGRLYVVASVGLLGQGFLYESADPSRGNDSFRRATPPEMTVYEAGTFNGQLYVGTGDKQTPFTLVRTPALGDPPYRFSQVIPPGGDLAKSPSHAVVSLHAFKGQLYVGTDRPAELYRVNTDDSWELLVGSPRRSGASWRRPLSGMGPGFDWPFNIHMWRMESYNGELYIGTMDQSTHWSSLLFVGRWLRPQAGFDLYRTRDGRRYTMLTRTGFGDKYNVGVRNFEVTPYGLFMGSANHYYGAQLWRTSGPSPTIAASTDILRGAHRIYLPLLVAGLSGEGLEASQTDTGVQLDWSPTSGAVAYQILRAELTSHILPIPGTENPLLPGEQAEIWVPGEFETIATTTGPHYRDMGSRTGGHYQYYVVPIDAGGEFGEPSNLVPVPGL